MRYIKPEILRILYARSGNQCAFPGCSHPIFNNDNLFIAQICHIEAVSPNGQRYNSTQTDDQRNSYDNLILMCYRHHKEIDYVDKYTVESLRQIKKKHEDQFKESKDKMTDTQLEQLTNEINNYWKRIDYLNTQEHVAEDFKIDINSEHSTIDLIQEIDNCLSNIIQFNQYIIEDYKDKLFEIVCLGIPNNISIASVKLLQLKIRILEQQILLEPDNEVLQLELLYYRDEFEETAKSSGLAD